MFANLGWGEMLVLVIIGLVVLGPERLPGAIRWTAGTVRQARDYVSGATSQLRQDLGPEFEDLREPLSELQKLRGMTPRAALTKHLLDGDDSLFTGKFDTGKFDNAQSGSDRAAAKPADAVVPPAVAQRAPGTTALESSANTPAVVTTPFDTDAT
jgi:sec-independent protein translocase protein TatB